MEELSIVDKKIIYELGRDSRQSYKKIAQRTKSKKEIVSYHITNLLNKEIITKFVPVISLTKLGIYSFKIYLKLHGLSESSEKQMYKELNDNQNIIWIAKSIGQWDLLLGFYNTDIVSFSNKKNEILSRFSQFIEGYDITMIEDALVFNRDYLVEKKPDYRKEFIFGGEQKRVQIKKDELKLLSLIRDDGRFLVLDVAKKLNQDPRTIISKIKKLEKQEIIQGYTTFLNLQKIGYQLHKLCIYFSTHEKQEINRVVSFIKQNSHVIHIIKSLGSWELEVEIESNNINYVYNYVKELKNNFPQQIKRIDQVTIVEEPKLEFFPENIDN